TPPISLTIPLQKSRDENRGRCSLVFCTSSNFINVCSDLASQRTGIDYVFARNRRVTVVAIRAKEIIESSNGVPDTPLDPAIAKPLNSPNAHAPVASRAIKVERQRVATMSQSKRRATMASTASPTRIVIVTSPSWHHTSQAAPALKASGTARRAPVASSDQPTKTKMKKSTIMTSIRAHPGMRKRTSQEPGRLEQRPPDAIDRGYAHWSPIAAVEGIRRVAEKEDLVGDQGSATVPRGQNPTGIVPRQPRHGA